MAQIIPDKNYRNSAGFLSLKMAVFAEMKSKSVINSTNELKNNAHVSLIILNRKGV